MSSKLCPIPDSIQSQATINPPAKPHCACFFFFRISGYLPYHSETTCFNQQHSLWSLIANILNTERSRLIFLIAVILLPAHPESFAHNFVSGMQSFNFIESQDAIELQICLLKIVFWTHKFAVGLIDMGNRESQDR